MSILDNEFERFRVFENLYILLNHCQNCPHLKFNIYTFNSSLIFPKFYKQVILKNHTLQLSQTKSIISSSLKTSIEKYYSQIIVCRATISLVIYLLTKLFQVC